MNFSFDVALPPGVQAPPEIADEPITVTALEIRGASALPSSAFDAIRDSLVGKQTTVGALFAAARAVEARYRDRGYFLSFAFVPEQSTADGRFVIEVVEGYIAKVAVRTGGGGGADAVEALLRPLVRERPSRLASLERQLLLVNELPGVRGRAVIQPGPEPGSSELVVDVERTPWSASLSADNRGSKFAGPVSGTLAAAANGAFGLGERIGLLLNVTRPAKESRYGQLDVDLPLGADGARIVAAASRSLSKPGAGLNDLDVKTTADSYSLTASYPLIRSRSDTLVLSAGLGWKDTGTDILGGRVSRDRIRTVRLAASWSTVLPTDAFLNSVLTVTQGIRAFGAPEPGSADPSRRDADSRFTKLGFDLFVRQPLFDVLQLTWVASGQTTTRPLFAAEEFSLGGARIGRAYVNGEVSGEHGLGTGIELSAPIETAFGLPLVLQPYGFWDIGVAWQDNTPEGGTGSLSSAGIGLRVTGPGDLTASVEIARPLTRPLANEGRRLDNRVFWAVSGRF